MMIKKKYKNKNEWCRLHGDHLCSQHPSISSYGSAYKPKMRNTKKKQNEKPKTKTCKRI